MFCNHNAYNKNHVTQTSIYTEANELLEGVRNAISHYKIKQTDSSD